MTPKMATDKVNAPAVSLAPINAKNFDQLCMLQRDNFSTRNYWICLQEGSTEHDVAIYAQRSGEASSQNITIPRKDFLRLIDWYQKEQKTRKRHAKKRSS